MPTSEERVGFEPTERSSRSAVFKTAALSHSATSPRFANPYSTWVFRMSPQGGLGPLGATWSHLVTYLNVPSKQGLRKPIHRGAAEPFDCTGVDVECSICRTVPHE